MRHSGSVTSPRPAFLTFYVTVRLPTLPSGKKHSKQAERNGYLTASHFGSGSRMSKSDCERLLRQLHLLGAIHEDTVRQENYHSILSFVELQQVGFRF